MFVSKAALNVQVSRVRWFCDPKSGLLVWLGNVTLAVVCVVIYVHFILSF